MIWIFVFKDRAKTYENKKIVNEIVKQNLKEEFKFIDPNYLNILISEKIKFFYEGKEINKPTKLHVRVGCSLNEHIKDILNVLQTMNVKIINNLEQLEICTNKFLTASKLKEHNISYIKSLKMTGNNTYDLNFINNEFKYPLIIKSKIGSLGKGIYKIKNKDELKNILEQINLLDTNYEYLIQEYIIQGNVDYRVVVYKGQVKYVLKRTAIDGEFKTNYNLGNEVQLDEITEEIKNIVNQIYKAIPLDIMGLDLIQTHENDYKVCEINSNPGFKGKDSLTKEKSFAKEIINFIKEY